MGSSTRTIVIVGFGIAGQLLVLELLKAGIQGRDIVVLDKTFLGGDLVTEYGTVVSNTPWWKTKKALEAYPEFSAQAIQAGNSEFQDSQCMPVARISQLCFAVAHQAVKTAGITKITTHVQQVQKREDGLFHIQHSSSSLCCKLLFVTQGAVPKHLPLDIPIIPLSIALDIQLLSKHVSKEDQIAVIGTAHSGVLVLGHLHTLGVPTTALFKGTQPFRFVRDGAYDGLKECSEVIADSILQGKYPTISLQSLDSFFDAHLALKTSTKVILATGFEPRTLQGIPTAYLPETAELQGLQGAYGFGIAYPGVTVLEGKQYTDVSVLSFQSQIQRCLPQILMVNKDKLHLQ